MLGGIGFITSHGRVTSHALDQGGKDGSNADASTGETDGGETSSLHLRGSDDGHGSRLDDDAAGLHGIADDGGGHAGASRTVEEQTAMAGSGLTSLADDGTRDSS